MLGTIGFTVAALASLAYGLTSYKLARGKGDYDSHGFLAAYILIAAACLSWAISIHMDAGQLQTGVLLGDGLLLLASAFLAATTLPKAKQPLALVIGAVVTVLLVVLRMVTAQAESFVRDGILVFNTPRPFAAILSLILLAVWVRANMHFFTQVVDKAAQAALRPVYYSSNLFAFIGVTGFLLSRKNLTITVAFIIIVAAFVSLTVINTFVQRTVQKRKS